MPKNNYQKDYREWMGVKAKIHNTDNFRKVNEGDVFWAKNMP